MPSPVEIAEAHYAAQARQAEAATVLSARLWRGMGADLEESWARIVRRLTVIVGSAQLGAARAGAAYVPAALDGDFDPVGEVNPNRFAGVASDGRPLDSLLYSAVVRTRMHLAGPDSLPAALAAGGEWLDGLVRTQVADAARGAAGVAITARPRVGYVRHVEAPCCQRCAVLAGKKFRFNEGFLRHPRCLCKHLPAAEGEMPEGYKANIDPDQIRDLTQDQRRAIENGADLNQVINSHRKGRSDGMTTSEGVTRRGLAGQRLSGQQRLTPETIYRLSSDREQVLDLLRRHGYLI